MKNLQNILFGLLLCVVICCTTGCMKIAYNMDIDSDGNIKFKEIQAVNMDTFGGFGLNASQMEAQLDEQFKAQKEKAESDGYSVEKYKDDKFIGFTLKKDYTVDTFNEAELPLEIKAKGKPIEVKKGLFKNQYTINFEIDPQQVSNQNGAQQGSYSNDSSYSDTERIVSKERSVDGDGNVTEKIVYEDGGTSTTTYNEKEMQKLGKSMGEMLKASGFQADFTIKIPAKAKEHNATKVINNREYQWNLMSDKPVNISIKYDTPMNWKAIIAVLVSIAVLIGLYVQFKQNDNTSWH